MADVRLYGCLLDVCAICGRCMCVLCVSPKHVYIGIHVYVCVGPCYLGGGLGGCHVAVRGAHLGLILRRAIGQHLAPLGRQALQQQEKGVVIGLWVVGRGVR